MNEAKQTDRRVLRTRNMILDAFIAILEKKSYQDISVVDISEQANINRSTFYAHFIDREDLLEKLVAGKLELLKDQILKGMDEKKWKSSFYEPDPIFLALFEHAFEHDYFYRVMLANDTSGGFRSKVNDIIRDSFFRRLSELDMDQKLQVPLDILLDYISTSTSGIIDKWLRDNKVYSPGHMALQLTRLATLGVYKTMGITFGYKES
ncbi:TetR/AcrR family transcriptional regulator [Paenibacillus xylanexedens]|uniref:TetR/AcrR family transcriptional regulator n=1 Tax=Paenibacillus xylanexedens TaxID=528191 RepID=UPI0011A4F74F|nr:TetR/AcrR family transcriptional regulator [Paenibacillus xylanexedens]